MPPPLIKPFAKFFKSICRINKVMRQFFLKSALFIFGATGLLPSCAIYSPTPGMYLGSERDDCGLAVSQTIGKSVRWDKDDFPIEFYVHESTPVPAHKNFVAAVDNWNIAWEMYLSDRGLNSFPLFHIPNPRAQYSGSPGSDSHNMLFFVDNYKKHMKSDAQAITSIFSDMDGKIEDTDIIINNAMYEYFYDESYNRDIFAFRQRQKQARRGLASTSLPGFFARFFEKIQGWLKIFKKQKPLRKIARSPVRPPADKVDFPSLIIHEVKHVVSGQHCETRGLSRRCAPADATFKQDIAEDSWHETGGDYYSVMEPGLMQGRVRRDITNHDLEKLFCGYIGL